MKRVMPEVKVVIGLLLGSALISCSEQSESQVSDIELGERPMMLANLLEDSALRNQLTQCDLAELSPSKLSIGHRGAPFQFAEHTRESYIAAANQGAGILECDVTFTKDKELVCRHSQCDLHTTTNILATDLAQFCSTPPDLNSATPYANVQCCTSDITLAQFQTLKGKRDGGNKLAATIDDFLAATPGWSGIEAADYGELLTHKESIALFDSLGVSMTPELKVPQISMPFDENYTQEAYAAQMLNDYVEADINPARVYPQSFSLDDVSYWKKSMPVFAQKAVYLDGRYRNSSFDIENVNSWSPSMEQLANDGIRYLASPTWMLLSLDEQGEIVPSEYAVQAKIAGLELIAWTVERSGPITSGTNWYYQTINAAITNEGDVLRVIDVLVKQVSVVGIFSDWPATTTFYAHCAN